MPCFSNEVPGTLPREGKTKSSQSGPQSKFFFNRQEGKTAGSPISAVVLCSPAPLQPGFCTSQEWVSLSQASPQGIHTSKGKVEEGEGRGRGKQRKGKAEPRSNNTGLFRVSF